MGAQLRVLLIDDDQDFRASVRSLLESQGYEVFEADSGRSGLRRLPQCKPDIILVDVMMESDAEGYGITQSIKYRDDFAAFRNIPVFMISSIEESPDERFPMAAEAEMIRPDRYLTKPLNVPVFLDLLRRAIPVA